MEHEWIDFKKVEPALAQETCAHCGCIKYWDAIEGVMYKTADMLDSDRLLSDEPACSIRH